MFEAIVVFISMVAAAIGFASLSQATLGVGLIALACYLAILARLLQAGRYHHARDEPHWTARVEAPVVPPPAAEQPATDVGDAQSDARPTPTAPVANAAAAIDSSGSARLIGGVLLTVALAVGGSLWVMSYQTQPAVQNPVSASAGREPKESLEVLRARVFAMKVEPDAAASCQIQVHSAADIAHETGWTEARVLREYRINLWNEAGDARTRITGHLLPGSRADVLGRRGLYYRVRSPADQSEGWLSSQQVAFTIGEC